jgi:predicted  nucleic acid-binding Zn-ribbon protein
MSDIQDEAYSEAMEEIAKLKRRIAIRDAELANAAKVFQANALLIDELKRREKDAMEAVQRLDNRVIELTNLVAELADAMVAPEWICGITWDKWITLLKRAREAVK